MSHLSEQHWPWEWHVEPFFLHFTQMFFSHLSFFPASQHTSSLEHGIFLEAHKLGVGFIVVGTLVGESTGAGDGATVGWTVRLCASTLEIASVTNIP